MNQGDKTSISVPLTENDLQIFQQAVSDLAYQKLQEAREVKGMEVLEGNRNNRKGLEQDFRRAFGSYKRFCKLFDKINDSIRALNEINAAIDKPKEIKLD